MRKILLLGFVALISFQAKSQNAIPEYCLENDTVNHYLTQVQYDPNDYSYSKIRNYCLNYPWDWEGEGKGVRLDQPLPVPIKLAKALDVASTLYVSEFSDFSAVTTKIISVPQGVDSINVWNLIPGRTYNWKLVYGQNNDEVEAASGQFKTTGTLRMLKIDDVFNVRDMGGWMGLNGYPLRYGVIIRGSRLNVNSQSTLMITDSGIEELRWAGMRAELDMRDAGNSLNAQYAYFSKNNDSPLYSVNSAYNSRIATFANAPQSIIGVKKLIEWLKQGKHVYLHCSVGADRTGTVAYLVGALCGMSEDALCKEFELTSFSGDKIDNEADRGTWERLVRQRSYAGRLDKCSSPESYRFADMVDKIKSFQKAEHPEWTLQERVYYHLNTGAKGDGTFLSEKIPAADLDWLIKYMLNPINLNVDSQLDLERGQTKQIEVLLSKGDENDVTYVSSNPYVASVSENGLITAKRCGSAIVTVAVDGFETAVTVNIANVETQLPASAHYDGKGYLMKGKNIIRNGSFEYEDSLNYWTDASGSALSEENFMVKEYDGSVERYIESKADGDETSVNSISTQWRISSNKTYVFGYKVKNSTDIQTVNNANLKVSLIKTNASLDLEGYPSYDGNWTDVQYVFTNSDRYSKVQILFTHLSQNGNNTCFDDFYLAEVEYSAGVGPVRYDVTDGNVYDLNGRKVGQAVEGIIIKDGKKVLIK